jgi:cytochrome c oxidase cbb3-type subunit 3
MRFPGSAAVAGSLGWTSRGELEADQAAAAKDMAQVYAAYSSVPAETLSQDPKAMAIGQRLFINNCATCHGSDARGSKGFPHSHRQRLAARRLAREDRGDDHARPHRRHATDGAAVGNATAVHDVANYVLSLSKSPHDSIAASAGQGQVSRSAPPVHGADGKGNTAIGAPNLTDGVWLHGWGEARSPRSSTTARPTSCRRKAAACRRSRSTFWRATSGACRSRAGRPRR